MNDFDKIIRYISIWSWQIIALNFLSFGILFLVIRNMPLFISFISLFALCEFKSFERRKHLLNE